MIYQSLRKREDSTVLKLGVKVSTSIAPVKAPHSLFLWALIIGSFLLYFGVAIWIVLGP